MASTQELQVQKKRELENKEETTIPGRIFMPAADIYEARMAMRIVAEYRKNAEECRKLARDA